jgi:hypothetical protein
MANNFNKKFTHETSKDVFPSAKELAMEATKLGVTPQEFVKRYHTNMYFAPRWNTAQSFIATVVNVKIQDLEGGLRQAYLEYAVNAGKENESKGELLVGVLDPTDKTKPVNAMCTKIISLKGNKVVVYKGYHIKGDAEFAILLDVDELGSKIVSNN